MAEGKILQLSIDRKRDRVFIARVCYHISTTRIICETFKASSILGIKRYKQEESDTYVVHLYLTGDRPKVQMYVTEEDSEMLEKELFQSSSPNFYYPSTNSQKCTETNEIHDNVEAPTQQETGETVVDAIPDKLENTNNEVEQDKPFSPIKDIPDLRKNSAFRLLPKTDYGNVSNRTFVGMKEAVVFDFLKYVSNVLNEGIRSPDNEEILLFSNSDNILQHFTKDYTVSHDIFTSHASPSSLFVVEVVTELINLMEKANWFVLIHRHNDNDVTKSKRKKAYRYSVKSICDVYKLYKGQ